MGRSHKTLKVQKQLTTADSQLFQNAKIEVLHISGYIIKSRYYSFSLRATCCVESQTEDAFFSFRPGQYFLIILIFATSSKLVFAVRCATKMYPWLAVILNNIDYSWRNMCGEQKSNFGFSLRILLDPSL